MGDQISGFFAVCLLLCMSRTISTDAFCDFRQGKALKAVPQIVSQFLGARYESSDRTFVAIIKRWVVFHDRDFCLARGSHYGCVNYHWDVIKHE